MSSNAANVKKVQGKLKELSVQISKMRKAVPKIGTKKDGQKLRIEIESIRDICSSSIKELTALLGITTDCKSKREALELNKTYRTKFVRDFGSLQKDFKKVNSQTLELERKTSIRSSDITMVDITMAPDVDSNYSGGGEQQQQQFSMEQKQRVNQIHQQTVQTEQMLQQERHNEVQQINKDLHLVKDMFQDINGMMNEQGEDIDRIEQDVEAATDHVEKGTKDLQVAREIQDSIAKKKCVLLAIFIVILLAISLPLIINASKDS